MQSNRLGEILVKNNLISRENLSQALQEQKLSGNQLRLGTILINQKLVTEEQLTSFLSKHYGVPRVVSTIMR
jgi:type IV pilus assembly protein PilB